jgi:CheY-like chemotaxis protein
MNPLALVVDDEELLRLFAAGLLEEHGFEVLEAENAAAALKVLESHHGVRLLFTDIQMPGVLNGLDLAREVHARWPGVLLVITSGQRYRVAPTFQMTAALSVNLIGRRICSLRSTTSCVSHSSALAGLVSAARRFLLRPWWTGCSHITGFVRSAGCHRRLGPISAGSDA